MEDEDILSICSSEEVISVLTSNKMDSVELSIASSSELKELSIASSEELKELSIASSSELKELSIASSEELSIASSAESVELSIASSEEMSIASSQEQVQLSMASSEVLQLNTNEIPMASSIQGLKKRLRGSPEYSVNELMAHRCCHKNKVTCFKLLTQAAIERVRESIYSKSETQQVQVLLDYMLEHSQEGKSILYTVGGQVVCETCYRMVCGVRYNRFAAIKRKFENGVLRAEHGRYGRGVVSEANCRLVSWLRMFFDKVGDKMPTSDSIHLPSCLTKYDVYNLAVDDLTQGGLSCCKISTFYRIWKQNFPHVKIPKESRFSKCEVCTAIKEGRERTLNPSVREWLTQILEKHIQLERREREKYAKHRCKSEKYPDKYLSVIIDGMDQSKTDIPHIISNPKSMAGGYHLETHITGIRAHGHLTMMVIDCKDFHHDTNLTIEVLLQLLHRLKDNLPPTMYIQMGNTCRDNKNKYMFTFAAILVQLGIFRKIKFGFLPVGHTHEDIDQLFSCVSRHLQHRNAPTIPDLSNAVGGSFQPSPEVVVLESVTDAKGWMHQQISPLHDHLKAHQFKFQRNAQGDCRMYYKEWSTDDYWLPQLGIQILPADNPTPTTRPRKFSPCYDAASLKNLESTLGKITAYLDKAGAASWWATWLQEAKEHVGPQELHAYEGIWLLDELKRDGFSSSHNPAKSISHEFNNEYTPCIIEGVGEVRTRWIGRKGVREIQNSMAALKAQTQVAQLKKELDVLAMECKRAFEAAEVVNSNHPQIKQAVSLCLSYCSAETDGEETPGINSASHIGALWKEDDGKHQSAADQKELATSILGKTLVDVMVEENRQPPDIYIGSSRATVLQNRNILKELQVGMLVAATEGNFVKIGEVTGIPPNPSIQSEIEVNWMQQERAPHKPKWLRKFKASNHSGMLSIQDVILYSFELTRLGCLKKKSRDYLKDNMQ